MSELLETMKRQVREARVDFARDVDEVLTEIKQSAGTMTPAIGEIGYEEALAELRRVAVSAIDRCAWRRR